MNTFDRLEENEIKRCTKVVEVGLFLPTFDTSPFIASRVRERAIQEGIENRATCIGADADGESDLGCGIEV